MMNGSVVVADPSRLSPISLGELVLVGFCRGPKSAARLSRGFAPYVSANTVVRTVEELQAEGFIEAERRGRSLAASDRGRKSRLLSAALAGDMSFTKVKETLLPCAALGLGLSKTEIARFGRVDNLRAAAVAVLYDLDLSPAVATLSVAREQLLHKVLWSRFPTMSRVVTNGKAKLDPFSVAILRSVAGLERGNVTSVVNALACGGLGAKDYGSDGFRQALVRSSLRDPADGRKDDFVSRVQALVSDKVTPPFSDRLAVGTLYDAYGREYDDARSLSDFKDRLISAHRHRRILLRRLDNTRAIDTDLRERSEIDVEGHKFHFVARTAQ